jgi:hypothetical protein
VVVAVLAHARPSLLQKICVARDETCEVYGFVFFRDGEWIETVVDDYLYLQHKDYVATESGPNGIKEREWKKDNQTGSKALCLQNAKSEYNLAAFARESISKGTR